MYFCTVMLKVFNISTLILFVCFLFAPTITFAYKTELPYSMIMTEEEEINSKNKTNNNLNEEEEKEVHYYTFANFKNYLHYNPFMVRNADFSKNAIKDHLVYKVPSPPPDQL